MKSDKVDQKKLVMPYEHRVEKGRQDLPGTMRGPEVDRKVDNLTNTIESSEKICISQEIVEQPKGERQKETVASIMEANPERQSMEASSTLTDVGATGVKIEEQVQKGIENKHEKPIVKDEVKSVEAEKIIEEKLKYERKIQELKKHAGEIDKKVGNSKITKMVEIICRQDDVVIDDVEKILKRLDKLPTDKIAIEELVDILIKPLNQKVTDIRKVGSCYQANSEIIIGERAKFIASILIDDEGKMNIELIDLIKEIICSKHSISKKHDAVLRKTLDAIKLDGDLHSLLENIKAPNSDPNIQAIVRATLGLEPETPLTAMHSKQAVLSGMLADIRQGEMGSCFATAVAIKMHDQNPKQVAEELKSIIETGEFVKEVEGKRQTFHVPKIYIPIKFGKGIKITDADINDILKTPGVKKVVEMVGLDITKPEVQHELKSILTRLIKQNSDLAAIFSRLIHELALKKSGLKSTDIQFVDAVNKAHEELRALKIDLVPGKYNQIVIALGIKEDAERENALRPLKEEIGEEIINKIANLTSRIKSLNFGVPENYHKKIKMHNEFKQQLEMNFMAAGGENSLLRSWEYSVAAYGHADDKKMMVYFQEMFEQKSVDKTLWEMIWEVICNILGLEVEAQKMGPAERIGISHILKKVLDREGTEYSPFENFHRDEFSKAFAENFEKRLSERLLPKYEAGVFKLYDKARASDVALAVPLNDPKDIQRIIAEIADQAAGDCIIIDENASAKERGQQKAAKTTNDIGYKLDQEIKKESFLHDLMDAYVDKLGLSEERVTDIPELEKQFRSGFSGGRAEKVFGGYIGKPLKEVSFSNEPKEFIKNMVSNLTPMMKDKSVNIDGKSEIMFLMDASHHSFLMRPDPKMLKEVIDSKDVDAWIAKNLIEGKQTFIVADLNWVSEGQHLSLAIRNKGGELKFICIDEKNREVDLPASDANHNFGDSGFIVMFDVYYSY